MVWKHKLAFLFLLAAWSTTPSQQGGLTAYEKCRLITAADLRDSKAPGFGAYEVTERPFAGKPKLNLRSDPLAQSYPTLLKEEVSKGPNFAGHYRLVFWGCGSSCSQFAVVNLKTGRVINLEPPTDFSYVHFVADSKEVFPTSESDATALAFRRDSRLIVALGAFSDEEAREGAFYFVLDLDRLLLVHDTIVKKNCEPLR